MKQEIPLDGKEGRAHFDEMNILVAYHPTDKDYGNVKAVDLLNQLDLILIAMTSDNDETHITLERIAHKREFEKKKMCYGEGAALKAMTAQLEDEDMG
ncbi:protein phosphatase inhibitor 2 [Cooperia oncophora]